MLKQLRNLPKDFILKFFKNKSKAIFFFSAFLVLVFVALLSLKYGAINISGQKIADIILYHLGIGVEQYWDRTEDLIIWELRLPRAILALFAGAALTVSGVAMQAAVKNPLADPYILGISAGASAGATAVIAADLLDITAEYSVSIGAFTGASLSLLILFFLNKNNNDSVRLLLSGCVISILFSSFSSIIIFLAKDKDKISNVLFWLMGSIADANWTMVPLVISIVIIGILILMLYARQLNAMLIGVETAHTLGVNTRQLKWQLIFIVAVMIGVIVAFCGMIGFIGFVIPHIVRSLFGANHKFVIPISAFCGSVFLLCCDMVARTIVAPEELPIGIITSVIGAPFFIYILQRRKYTFGSRK